MAQFRLNLPDKEIKQFEELYGKTSEIFGEMTKAGAEVALKEILANCPIPELRSHVKLSRQYKTPSDGGINTKVYVSGYLPFSGNRKYFSRRGGNGSMYSTSKGVPASFVAIMYEYGRSGHPFPKRPFFRKSFKKGAIEKAMMEAQKTASGGLLDE